MITDVTQFRTGKERKEEQNSRKKVIYKCWSYLEKNFHKFEEVNKIKVALALCTKDIPQELKGEGFAPKTYIYIVKDGKATPGCGSDRIQVHTASEPTTN